MVNAVCVKYFPSKFIHIFSSRMPQMHALPMVCCEFWSSSILYSCCPGQFWRRRRFRRRRLFLVSHVIASVMCYKTYFA